ncbi:hypothetical protein [Streptosporangium jomthongense]|uniref:Uncharacterized protein n=1 Tax=Streptosporangium jomthongense TaxID=1193683 RepID=A0ABV8FAA2_9ACTN
MNAPITPTLPLNMLDLLVPDGSTLPLAWAVLVGDREQVGTHDGRPVYAPTVTSWHLVQVCGYEVDAGHFARDMGRASLGGIEVDQWNWYPASDGDELLELYGVVSGDETAAEVAIAPLTALLHKAGE